MRKGNTIKVIIKHPGFIPYINWIPNELSALQDIVGGYIEVVKLFSDVIVVCNEEGKLKGMDYNCTIWGEDFVGDIFFCGVDGEDFVDIPFDMKTMKKILPMLFQEVAV